MDGFLNIQLPVAMRAILTRLVAITPCVIISAAFPDNLNQMVNVVNSLLAFLLPFAFTPLVKYNCSEEFMGRFAAPKWEKYLLYTICFVIWLINAIAFSTEGGGLFGDSVHSMEKSFKKVILVILEVALQVCVSLFYSLFACDQYSFCLTCLFYRLKVFYAWWNWNCLRSPISSSTTLSNQQREHDLQLTEQAMIS